MNGTLACSAVDAVSVVLSRLFMDSDTQHAHIQAAFSSKVTDLYCSLIRKSVEYYKSAVKVSQQFVQRRKFSELLVKLVSIRNNNER